ncbi:helix-turn-helix domain-containing protein [Neorhizobium sp. LjRoot104]|uniref:helix-turn-helix domain-containing protein n=1 Tax=Neorhizobium sp. LjRoot104 TaxID=3342254 RepID=UPI003ED14E22
MNVQTKIQSFTCPCCRGFIGEAAPIEMVVDSLGHPMFVTLLNELSKKVGRNVRRQVLLDACYADDEDGGPDDAPRAFRANLSKLRKAIKDFGWTVECVGGRGRGNYGGAFYRLIPTEARQ